MSSFKKGYESAAAGGSSAYHILTKWKEWPLIAELLQGDQGSQADLVKAPPRSMVVWIEGGMLKFCFSKKGDPIKLFGSCRDAQDGLLCVEKALAAEDYEWKKTR